MKRTNYVKNIISPCLLYSGICGVFTGILIFLFKICASFFISLSDKAYDSMHENIIYLFAGIIFAAFIGFISSQILKFAPECKGGGIPKSIGILRGILSFNWIKSIFCLFPSAILTFFCGVPLGNEGPSVQMGTAVGKGTLRLFGKDSSAFERYTMTGGACAGFAVATASPIAGICFSFEEAHRKVSPMILMSAITSTLSAVMTSNALFGLIEKDSKLFSIVPTEVLPYGYIPISVLVGLAAALFAILFTKLYGTFGKLVTNILEKVPFALAIISIFSLTVVIGYFAHGAIGTGHHFIEALFQGKVPALYVCLFYLVIRLVMILLSTRFGISGGLFVPSLALGALVGTIVARIASSVGIIDEKYTGGLIVVGMVSYLAASSRIPLTAIIFSVEALAGLSNFVPVSIGVAVAYLAVELTGLPEFCHVSIEEQHKAQTKGLSEKKLSITLIVQENSFAEGKEFYDILLPYNCKVLSVEGRTEKYEGVVLAGDKVTLYCQSYHVEDTIKTLRNIFGTRDSFNYEVLYCEETKNTFINEA